VIGLFYSGDKYLITPLKESAMQFVNDIDVSQDIDAFLYILSELQTYNLCAIWSTIIGDMMQTVDVNHGHGHIAQFLQVLRKLHECGLPSWQCTIQHMNIQQAVTCQKLLFDEEFVRLPAAVAHQFIQTFHAPYYETRIDQETLWNATVAWAHAQCNDGDVDDRKCDVNGDSDRSTKLNRLIESFVPYFNFATMDAEFVREHVEPVQVLSDEHRIEIYRAHSMLLTKVLTELDMASKQHKERQQTLESQLKNAERNNRSLKKQHKSEMAQLLSQYNTLNNNMQIQQQQQHQSLQQSRPQSQSTHSMTMTMSQNAMYAMTRPSSHSYSHSYSHSHPQSLSLSHAQAHATPPSHSHSHQSHAHAMSMAMSSSSVLVPALLQQQQQHGQNENDSHSTSTTTTMTTATHASRMRTILIRHQRRRRR